MLAVELHEEAGPARDYVEALARRGVLAKDTHDHTIRIAPPLIITRAGGRLGDRAICRRAEVGAAPQSDVE